MNMNVNIIFEIPDKDECDSIFKYLEDHPKDIWNYEERVKQSFHAHGFETNFDAHWTDSDILDTKVSRLTFKENPNMIQYEVTLRQDAKDPRLLVDLLRRCKSTQEGNISSNWTIHAWYRREDEDTWTADAGNNGRLTRYSMKIQRLLCQMKQMLDK
jgi:hypothetical protein